ncbi:cation transporter [Silvibacterium dinghuense]|uniref:cation diffusion facilitator family transporter n=1 Tax=Silvibacterium dinghuense TaxID=1560006 RepID=UPI00166BC5EC|nr:cation diffusion facilitator family transporter [Silvibacterium dinghuense]GGH00925.1 cation transporter [Silvibacterium dinghuense]
MSLAVTLSFCTFEAIAGKASHSLALVSDAGHNLSDALALGLAAYALHSMSRPAKGRHTYGFQRISALTALFNASALIVIAILIGLGALERFQHPQPLAGNIMIWVALISVLMNTLIAVALAGDAKNSLNSRAAMIHMAGDAISAAGVVAAGIVVRYTGWGYADAVVSLLIAAFIAWSGVGVLREAGDILMEKAPRHLDPAELAATIREIPSVCNVHDLHVWTVGEGRSFLSCHVAFAAGTSLDACSSVINNIAGQLRKSFSIDHATIQPEIVGACEMASLNAFYCAPEPKPTQAHHHGCTHHH